MAGTSVAERGLRRVGAAASGGEEVAACNRSDCPGSAGARAVRGLIYYCIWYTAVISTWDWDGIDPNPERVGAENYIRIAQDPIFWKTIRTRSCSSSSPSSCRPRSA